MNEVIRNPILPGFHPDPSIVRVGPDFYLATSTFEWCPGVRVHHSRDLMHWRPLGGILDEPRLLELSGVPDSGGVWAPDLTYANGRFHLVYSVMDNYSYGYKDVVNYLITASDITGPWSDPILLHGRGFDASLFHDTDGTTWYLNMLALPQPGRGFSGIEAQRLEDGRLVGERLTITDGTDAGVTEGPHLYRHGDWYYLVAAEGGTGYDHQATVFRAPELTGPYEPDPAGPMITSRDDPDNPLQKAGHGCLVSTEAGQTFLTYLVGRPYGTRGRCVLGRETAIAPVRWQDGWPRVPGAAPELTVPGPASQVRGQSWPEEPERQDFDERELGPNWSTLRRHPSPDWLSLTERDGHLRIYGGQSPHGHRAQSLVARRVTAKRCEFEIGMEFTPATELQSAGLTAYYNSVNWYFLQVSLEDGEPTLALITSDAGNRTYHPGVPVDGPVELRVEFDGPALRFAYKVGRAWQDLPTECDATILSDEYAFGVEGTAGFTGAFVGMWVQGPAGESGYADFDHATYRTEAE